jgi:hypothetical protein
MAHKQSFGLPLAIVFLASLGASISGSAMALAQADHVTDKERSVATPQSRIIGDWRSSDAVMVPASKSHAPSSGTPISLTQTAAPADARLDRMLLLLSPSVAQQKELTAELASLQDPASPKYHQWLTPTAFADAYSNSAADVLVVSAWLQSEGFQVASLPAGRGWIEFSGTVAQVERAFHTRVNSVGAAGSTFPSADSRFILAEGISVPVGLAPMVQGLVSLDGALSAPALTQPETVSISATELASQTSLRNTAALTPQLAGQLLYFDALQSAGINGAGETIAIAARSGVNSSDVAAFHAAFGLPASPVKILSSGIGSDFGLTADRAEATLAASWAGAVAPAAQIIVAPAATTNATDGLDLSLAAIVDQALAHTVAVGYSTCESALAPAHQAFYAALYRQAAAEGISVIAAAGDSGPSACHLAGSVNPVSSGYGVNALASTPWNTAVGVAAFGVAGPSAEASALSAWSPINGAEPAIAGGGGSSRLYAEPAWQPIPSLLQHSQDATGTHNRLLPDLALPTAIDFTQNPGLAFCFSGDTPSTTCTLARVGGSSAAAALFAGIAALVDQKNGTQGNLAPHLYALSRQSGIFTDVDQGSAQLACVEGSQGCGADGLIGFTAGSGYDQATGLGVVDAQALVTRWARPQVTGSGADTVNLAVSPTELNSTYNPSATLTFTATVVSGTGGATPTGTVTFLNTSEGQPLSLTPSTLNSSGIATLTVEGVFGPGGNEIQAVYSGDSTYASSSSTPQLNINMQPSTTSLAVVPSATSVTEGQIISVTATLTVGNPPEGSAVPTGTVTMDLDGLPTTTAGLTTTSGVTSATFSVTIPANPSVSTHALQAVYAGNANYAASTSPSVTVTIAKSPSAITVTPATVSPSAGSSLMVSASITSSSPASTNPTGTVNFLIDNVSQGVGPVTSGLPATASFTIPVIQAGTHALTATYSGDGNYASSTSASVTLTAAKSATTTTLTATPPVLSVAGTETLTATIAPVSAVTGTAYTITGTVSFYDGGTTLLGMATLSSNVAALTGVTLPNNVSHSITAIYSGDPNWLTSTSAALALVATTLPDNVVLTSNLSGASPGQALILTATVTPTSTPATGYEQNPSGNVIFYNGTTIIGTVALTPAPLGDSSTATFTTESLPGGEDALSAVYQGDLHFDAATSNLLTLAIEDFTVVPSPSNPATNLNIVQGTAGSASFVINGLGGFNNTIQVVCAVPSQDDLTCTASPQQITPSATVSFVIQTFLPGQQTTSTTVGRNNSHLWPRAAGGAALAILGFFLLPFGRRARIFSRRPGRSFGRRLLILLLLLVSLGSAGIGCTNVNGVNGNETPLGVATLKITATAFVNNTVVSHSVYQTVDVLAPGSTP